jgi:DNA repair exonuclease SbcCD ATPase subunit
VESSLFALISDLVKGGMVADTTLLLIIIGLIGLGYTQIIKPLMSRVEKSVTLENIKTVADEIHKENELNIEEVSKKLDKIVEVLDEIESSGENNRRDIKELRRDVEHIKQILNQFQGHLMYGGGPSHFGNRELK